jgi:hypothetical protein
VVPVLERDIRRSKGVDREADELSVRVDDAEGDGDGHLMAVEIVNSAVCPQKNPLAKVLMVPIGKELTAAAFGFGWCFQDSDSGRGSIGCRC